MYITIFYTKKIYNPYFCHSLLCFYLCYCLCYELTLFIPIYHKRLNWYLYSYMYIITYTTYYLLVKGIYFMKKNQQNFLYILSIGHAKLHMDRHNLLRFCQLCPSFRIWEKNCFHFRSKTDCILQIEFLFVILQLSIFFNCQIDSSFGTTTKNQFMSAFNDWALIF